MAAPGEALLLAAVWAKVDAGSFGDGGSTGCEAEPKPTSKPSEETHKVVFKLAADLSLRSQQTADYVCPST